MKIKHSKQPLIWQMLI